MSQWSRLLGYGKRFVRDRQFRNRLIDTMARQVDGAAGPAASSRTKDVPYLDLLRGKRIFAAAGCEVTFMLDRLASLGMVTSHSHADGRAMDPWTELQTPGSRALTEEWDAFVLSAAQVIRQPIQRIQTEGMTYPHEQVDADAKGILGGLRHAITLLRARSAAPIFLFTYVSSYRPGLGLHEYRSLKKCWSFVEFLHWYNLKLYALARSFPEVYVLDVRLALEASGTEGAVDAEASSGIFDHLSREGGRVLANHLMEHLLVLDRRLKRVKCAVFDLDGTLWAGVLREDGPAGVVVRNYSLDVMQLLAARGILLAVCSKNDEVEREHLPALLGNAIYPKIVACHLSWAPKSSVLASIAAELNIGLDSLAFFDDSAFERAEVQANAPGVLVLTPDDIYRSPNMPEFQPLGEVTSEALTRTAKYQQAAVRKQAEREAGPGLDEFLASCGLQLTLRPMSAGETSRVFELLQRTNQLNATLTRTSLEQLQGYLASPARHVMHVAILRDRFGDYGLIGFVACEIEGARWRLLELALSCRAAGRGVERAMLSHLGALAQKAGAESLVLRYVAGPRNQEMLRILRECGFAGPGDAGGAEGVPAELVRDLKPGTSFAHPDWLSVSTPAAPARSEEPRPHAAEP